MRKITLLSALLLIGINVAFAGLKPTAPKNVDLSGLWQINPDLSDDPQQLLDKKRAKSMGRHGRGMGGRRGMDGGWGGGGAGGRGGGPGGGWGGGTGGSSGGGPSGGAGGSGGGGHSGHHRDDGDSDDSEHSGDSPRPEVDPMLATQEQLDIRQQPSALTFSGIEASSTCTTGAAAQVSMPDGNLADRQCGWKGKKFIVELKSPKGLTRTDQYELTKKADQLIVITKFEGGRGPLSGLKIKRTYDRIVAR
jgi:hypothetical protein